MALRPLFAPLLAALLLGLSAGCFSATEAPECLPATEAAACTGAMGLADGSCVGAEVDALPAQPGPGATPVLSITRTGEDPSMSIGVPLAFQQLEVVESTDASLARVWTTWVSRSDDLPADMLAAPSPGARSTASYRLKLQWSEDRDAVQDGWLEVERDATTERIAIDCAAR